MESKIKIERKIPCQGRIDLVDLARLEAYYTQNGYVIRSMSDLLSKGIELLCQVLDKNGSLPVGITTLAEAYKYLSVRGLMTRGMMKRGQKKLAEAIAFESMRASGHDPQLVKPRSYNKLHNTGSVGSRSEFTIETESPAGARAKLEAIMEVHGELESERIQDSIKSTLAKAKDSGMLVEEDNDDWIAERHRKEEERLALERVASDPGNLEMVDGDGNIIKRTGAEDDNIDLPDNASTDARDGHSS